VDVRPLRDADRDRARAWLRERWGDETMAAHGELFHPADHAGFIAGDWEGLLTYRVDGTDCEVTGIASWPEGRGAGSAMLAAVREAARAAGCTRVWLVTTNDNLHAQEWYRRKGFTVTAVREGAVDRSRRELKPSIPTHNAENGLPISDEIELSAPLT
jgi:ribosomal protein S18 acetylase RimI-like enzyme